MATRNGLLKFHITSTVFSSTAAFAERSVTHFGSVMAYDAGMEA